MRKRFFDRERHPERDYWLCYTLLFCVLAFCCFIYFLAEGKSFVHAGDGFNQHYKALLYFARWMREILRTLICDHTLAIPNFSVRFGLGADLFTTLQYYVIGDPFAFPAVFVPSKYMVYYYGFMIVFRLYLSGAAFLAYANYMGKERKASLAGSLIYAFCAYAFFASVHHPYFANPMVYFPLLLLGVEKVRRERKPWLLIGMVAISAGSNFYFFYMLTLLVVCYVLLEAFLPWEKGKWKEKAGLLIKTAGYFLVGGLLSAVLFLPVVLFFLTSTRLESEYTFDFFYGLSYYKKFLAGLITDNSPGSWTHLGVSAVTLFAIFLLFRKKGKRYFRLKTAFFISMIAFLLPVAGHIANGFSYVSNRWSWGVVFLFAYIFTEMWPDLFRMRKKDCAYLAVCLAVYFVLCVLPYHKAAGNFYFSVGLAAAALAVLAAGRMFSGKKAIIYTKGAEYFLFAVLALGIVGMAYTMYAASAGNYISKFKDVKDFQKQILATEAAAIQNADSSDDFFRYSDAGATIVSNGSVISGVSNTHTYWSLMNSSVTDLYDKTLTSLNQVYNIKGFDVRTIMEEICSTKYFVSETPNDRVLPYGYHLLSKTEVAKPDGSANTYYVYENEYALPFGFTYTSSITEEQAQKLTPLQRQEAMMQTVILEGGSPESGKQARGFGEISFTSTNPDYKITCNSNEITMQENSFVVTKENQSVTLTFSGAADCETYLSLENLQFVGMTKYDMQSPVKFNLTAAAKHEDGSESKNTVVFQTPKYKWYNNRRDFLFHLYYAKSPVTSIVLTFPKRGIYTFDNMSVQCQPFAGYAKQAELLKEDVLDHLDLHENEANATNHITGTIRLQTSKILFLSIPYSPGWKAYIDGKETEILKANYAFMALPLSDGEHEIELKYHTPGLKSGICISLAGVAAVIFISIYRKRKS